MRSSRSRTLSVLATVSCTVVVPAAGSRICNSNATKPSESAGISTARPRPSGRPTWHRCMIAQQPRDPPRPCTTPIINGTPSARRRLVADPPARRGVPRGDFEAAERALREIHARRRRAGRAEPRGIPASPPGPAVRPPRHPKTVDGRGFVDTRTEPAVRCAPFRPTEVSMTKAAVGRARNRGRTAGDLQQEVGR